MPGLVPTDQRPQGRKDTGFLPAEQFFQQLSPQSNFFRTSRGGILGPAFCWNVLCLWAWTTVSDIHRENLEAHYDPPSTRKYPCVLSTLDLWTYEGSEGLSILSRFRQMVFCLALKAPWRRTPSSHEHPFIKCQSHKEAQAGSGFPDS